MTFVFVTAQNWQGKEAWVAKQRSLGQWRDVRAYDAVDLEQWLERSATTQLWFARELGRSLDGIVPVAACWRRWTESTSRSEEHTYELQSLMRISYAVFCLKKTR